MVRGTPRSPGRVPGWLWRSQTPPPFPVPVRPRSRPTLGCGPNAKRINWFDRDLYHKNSGHKILTMCSNSFSFTLVEAHFILGLRKEYLISNSISSTIASTHGLSHSLLCRNVGNRRPPYPFVNIGFPHISQGMQWGEYYLYLIGQCSPRWNALLRDVEFTVEIFIRIGDESFMNHVILFRTTTPLRCCETAISVICSKLIN